MCWQCDALYAAVVSCSSSIRSTAAMSSGGIFGAMLAVVRSLGPAVLTRCAVKGLGLRVEECAASAFQLW